MIRLVHSPPGMMSGQVRNSRSRHSAADCFTTSIVSPDTSSFGISFENASAISWLPISVLAEFRTPIPVLNSTPRAPPHTPTGDALGLVGVGVAEAGGLARLATEQSVQVRADLVLATGLDGVALGAPLHEQLLALLNITSWDTHCCWLKI
uniref:Uncharacterized protein n=1 Tax=Anopheles coluzzii TaxID=1518534 RepID=A0A8W7PK37_ANOCL